MSKSRRPFLRVTNKKSETRVNDTLSQIKRSGHFEKKTFKILKVDFTLNENWVRFILAERFAKKSGRSAYSFHPNCFFGTLEKVIFSQYNIRYSGRSKKRKK